MTLKVICQANNYIPPTYLYINDYIVTSRCIFFYFSQFQRDDHDNVLFSYLKTKTRNLKF